MTTTTINPMVDRAAWLAERRNGIGASEAAMALGLSPFGSPTELALRKLGRLPEAEENEAMELGSLMEPVIRQLYERRTGRAIVQEQSFLRCPLETFLSATLDGIDDRGDLVEYKTTGLHSDASKGLGEEGTDEVPEHWIIQAHQQMYVASKERVHFAVLVGGQTFRAFTVERNEVLVCRMVAGLTRFWEAVQRGEVPQDEGAIYSPRILAALNPECEGEFVAGPTLAGWIEEYEFLKDRMRDDKLDLEHLKTQILQSMATLQVAKLPDGRIAKRYLEHTKERTQVVRAGTKHYFKILKGA